MILVHKVVIWSVGEDNLNMCRDVVVTKTQKNKTKQNKLVYRGFLEHVVTACGSWLLMKGAPPHLEHIDRDDH
jgi:hypothetical protein